jgi:GPH family glycoside/pentoside/hexuronide:cation symporter
VNTLSEEKNQYEHPKWEMASYGFGPALNQFFRMAYVSFAFYFYESELGLNVWFTGIAFIIFAIWNAINDPLVGYLTDRPFRFSKKWGVRFPWTIIGGIPWVFSYILIFLPGVIAVSGDWVLFAWLTFSTCLFDTFNSIWWVNFYAVFPEKFRDLDERRMASGIITPVGIIGIVLGGILPVILITYGSASSYFFQAIIISLVGLLIFSFGLPGWRDDPKSINNYLESYRNEKSKISFFKILRKGFKQRSFTVYLFIYFTFQVLIFCIQSSLPYFVVFVLDRTKGTQLFIQATFLIGALVTVPIWIKLARSKNNNKIIYLTSATLLAAFSFPLTFITNLVLILIIVFFWGIALGGLWSMERPIISDIIDESKLHTKQRHEGVYVSVAMFFNRLAIIAQALIFAIIHTLTGFSEGLTSLQELQIANPNWEFAVLGIQLHFGIIPALFLVVGVLLFWKLYDLTPDKVGEVQDQLQGIKY